MNMRLKPALRHTLRDMLLGCLPFFAVMVLIVLGSALYNVYYHHNVSFNGYGVTFAICLFVYGIVMPRSCLRLCAQLGVSRRTGFLSCLIAALCAALLLALGGDVLLALGAAIDHTGSHASDLYQLIYLEENTAMSLGQHGLSILYNATMMLALYCGGMFFTFLFWRLNRLWTVVAALAIPVVINGGILLISRSSAVALAVNAVFTWGLSSVWNAMLAFLLLAAALALVNWLLVFRAYIRASSAK